MTPLTQGDTRSENVSAASVAGSPCSDFISKNKTWRQHERNNLTGVSDCTGSSWGWARAQGTGLCCRTGPCSRETVRHPGAGRTLTGSWLWRTAGRKLPTPPQSREGCGEGPTPPAGPWDPLGGQGRAPGVPPHLPPPRPGRGIWLPGGTRARARGCREGKVPSVRGGGQREPGEPGHPPVVVGAGFGGQCPVRGEHRVTVRRSRGGPRLQDVGAV